MELLNASDASCHLAEFTELYEWSDDALIKWPGMIAVISVYFAPATPTLYLRWPATHVNVAHVGFIRALAALLLRSGK
jgi:hypothetical protein